MRYSAHESPILRPFPIRIGRGRIPQDGFPIREHCGDCLYFRQGQVEALSKSACVAATSHDRAEVKGQVKMRSIAPP